MILIGGLNQYSHGKFLFCVIFFTRNDVACIALYNFNALDSDELSFKKGEQFKVIKPFADGWWLCKCLSTNREGFIPSNYVTPRAHE